MARSARTSASFPRVGAARGIFRVAVPPEFRPARGTLPGRSPFQAVFRGLEKTVPFRKYPGDDAAILDIAERTWAHLPEVPGWMYGAPRKTPAEVRAAGFRTVESRDDEIVVAIDPLAKGPMIDVYLGGTHAFLHILQRRHGRELSPGARGQYVERPTEVEAYAFSVVEARRLGASDASLRSDLELPWVRRAEYLRLLRNLGVRPPGRTRRTR